MDLTQQSRETLKVIDAEYTVESEGHSVPQPIVHLFCRDADRNKRHIEVEGFRPYFMMARDEFFDRYSDVINDRHVLAVEGDFGDVVLPGDRVAQWLTTNANETNVYHKPDTFDALDGTDLVKVFTVEPAHVGKIRDHWNRTWEADVPFERRFLISSEIYHGCSVPTGADRVRYENWDGHSSSDTQVHEIRPADPPDVHPRVLYTDIEVETQGDGMPDPADARKPVNAITAYDNYTESYVAWILESDEWDETEHDFESIDDDLGIDGYEVREYDHEASMVEDYVQWVIDHDFDLFTAWNAMFDYAYLINRAYDVSAYSVRQWSVFEDSNPGAWRDDRDDIQVKITGRVVWDMLEAYEKTQYRDLESYSLEHVAQKELGMGKEKIGDLDTAWHETPYDFLKYNVRDVQAMVQIESESGLLNLFDNLRQVVGASYTTCYNNGPMIDTLFLRQAYENDTALTTNYAPDQGDYAGAKVFEPVPGIHENVVYPDLACFTPDTDVVTPDGIRSITELDVGDVVYSIDPETNTVTKKPIVETHEYPDYDGELVNVQSTRTDFSVTPNHNMLLRRQNESTASFVEAGDIDERNYWKLVSEWEFDDDANGIDTVDVTEFVDDSIYDVCARYDCHGHHFRAQLPDECTKKRANYHEGFFFDGETYSEFEDEIQSAATSCELTDARGTGATFRPIAFDGDDFIEFIGWFIAEGSVYRPNGDNTAAIKIAQEDADARSDIVSLLERNGIEPSVDKRGVTFGSEVYGTIFENLCGESSSVKTIPDFIFDDASTRQKELLFETLLRGDGHDEIYYTSSDELVEDVTRLCVELGRKPIVRQRDRTTASGHTEWEIQTKHVTDGITTGEHVSSESSAENGVYCVTVADNHTLLAGRNGKFQWVGQSLYPYIMWTLNISPETMYMEKDEYRRDGYTDEDVFTAYIDDRDWKVVSSGETVKPSQIDKHKYKGVHDENGSRKKRTSVGFDGIFEPLVDEYPQSKTEIYFLKPDVQEGFIRSTVDLLVDLKYQYKGQGDMYAAVKRVTNSLYGTLGDSASGGKGFRLFDWKLAESITNVGRMVIEFTAEEYVRIINEISEDVGFESDSYLVGGDTDSCMAAIPQAPDYETALEWSERASETVSGELYDQFMEDQFNVIQGRDEHKMDVEIESLASGLFFTRDWDRDEDIAVKKRYAQHIIWDEDDGWLDTEYEEPDDPDDRSALKYSSTVSYDDYEDGGALADHGSPEDHIGITGFEYVRSDTATITKEVQLQLFTDILLADDPSDAIYDNLSQVVDDIKNGRVSAAKMGRPKGISNALDEYGWKTTEELANDTNYTVTETDRQNGGRYVATPGPTYRGRKYAVDHFDWEDGDQKKCTRLYIDRVRGNDYPAAYRYDEFPRDDRPDPTEVGDDVDAITVEYVDRVPDDFVVDYDLMLEKEVRDKVEGILRTIGEEWDSIAGEGRQSGLDQWT